MIAVSAIFWTTVSRSTSYLVPVVNITAICAFRFVIFITSRSQHGGDQRRVKSLRIHRLVQKLICPGADLALRSARIAADEERWNFGRTAERAAEPFDGALTPVSPPDN
jgi:hypothetical protein